VIQVSCSAFYGYLKRLAKLISEEELNMYRTARQLFTRSRGNLDSRQLFKDLRLAGYRTPVLCVS